MPIKFLSITNYLLWRPNNPLSLRERVRVRGAELIYMAFLPPHPVFGHLLPQGEGTNGRSVPIRSKLLFALLTTIMIGAAPVIASELPVCSNRVINEVTTRVGCTVGDANCWLTSGGFCTDYVEKMARRGQKVQLKPINAGDVRKGDIARFASRAHYSYVEKVVKGKNGKPVAVNLSEYNFGTCWVDEQSMVTEKYKVVNKRQGVPIGNVDGGFLRPR